MKRILIPTDFSSYSDFSITSSAKFAEKIGAKVTLLHVFNEKEQTKSKADEQVEMVRSSNIFGDTPFEFKMVEGDPIKAITKYPADYIIMGSRVVKGVHAFFHPTNSERVAKLAQCPVITLKNYKDLSDIKRIIFPTDMRAEQDLFIPEIKYLQELYGATIHLVKVYEDAIVKESQVTKRLRNFAEFHQLTNYRVHGVPGLNEAEEISNFALEINADLIALLTHERNKFERLIGGYVSGSLIRQSHVGIYSKVINPSS
jgi:nucleotide-binding universal stress UspA family protein